MLRRLGLALGCLFATVLVLGVAVAPVGASPLRQTAVSARSAARSHAPSRPLAASLLTRAERLQLGTNLHAGAQTARVVSWTNVQNRPGPSGRTWTAVGPLTSWSQEPQTLLVIGTATVLGREWIRVLLGIRPDGSNGWIPANRVVLGSDPYWIRVDKTTHTVTVYRDAIQQLHVQAVIGASATPTPDGIAAVWESDRQPSANDFLGAWAMPTTLLSNVLTNFGGGPGRIAIHGRGGASLENPLGTSASHGCIRIDNTAILWMAKRIHQGTPVDVVG